MNDVSVARGVMTCLLPNVINDTLYKVLTELTVRPIFKAWDAVRNIMLQNCLYSNNFIIVRLPTQNASCNGCDMVGRTRPHPKVDVGLSHTKSRGRIYSIHCQGGLRSNGGTMRARWVLYIRTNVRGQGT